MPNPLPSPREGERLSEMMDRIFDGILEFCRTPIPVPMEPAQRTKEEGKP